MEIILAILLVCALVGFFLLWKFLTSRWEKKWEDRETNYREEIVRRQEEADRLREEELRQQKDHFETLMERRIKDARESTKRGLFAKIGGEALQKFVGWMGDFQEHYNPEDVVPLNNIVDYLVFVGRSNRNITEIVLAEVKSGGAYLRKDQKQVLDLVLDGRVRGEVWQLDKDTGKLLFLDREGQRKYLREKGSVYPRKQSTVKGVMQQVEEAQKGGLEIEFVEGEPSNE